MDKLPFDLPDFTPGWVWLAGAGPGDPGLVTLLTLTALRQADVIVYDALVSDEILSLANPDAEMEFAGKRGGRPSAKQPDITKSLISHAKAGKRVLRLKGGDPFVFGRGGEEALELVAADVPFRVVPAVTAAIGGLAYAGMPVTHRETNTAVTFLTGHTALGDVPDDFDWEGLAKGSPVLVVYMGSRHLERIANNLMEAGRNPAEPVALISRATWPDQEVVVTDLKNSAAALTEGNLKSPIMFVVGEIVRLREDLDWLSKIPR